MPFDGEAAALCRSMMRRIEDDAAMTMVHYCAWSLSLSKQRSRSGCTSCGTSLLDSLRSRILGLSIRIRFKGSEFLIHFIYWKVLLLLKIACFDCFAMIRSSDRSRSIVFCLPIVFGVSLFIPGIYSVLAPVLSQSKCDNVLWLRIKAEPMFVGQRSVILGNDGDKEIIVWTIIFLVNGLIRTFIVI